MLLCHAAAVVAVHMMFNWTQVITPPGFVPVDYKSMTSAISRRQGLAHYLQGVIYLSETNETLLVENK